MIPRPSSVERFLVAPRTVLAEFLAFLALTLTGLWLGIERVLYSWWFVACALAGLISLGTATWGMLRRDVRAIRTTGHPRLRGVTVFHLGLVSALLFSGIGLATESQGIFLLVEGQTLPSGSVPVTETRAPLASAFTLPEPVTLALVSPSWWEDGSIRQIASEIAIGESSNLRVLSVNGSFAVDGVRYYQDQRFGSAYFLTLTHADGTVYQQRIDMSEPGPGEPTYAEVELGDGTILRARASWQGDAWGVTTLDVKLSDDAGETPSVVFSSPGTGEAGEWTIALDDVRRWTAIVVARQRGIWLLFLSFLVVGVGAIMMYAAPMGPKPGRRHGGSRLQ